MEEQSKQNKKLLITGCGRSGTLYSAHLWQALGLDIRHERPVPPDGMIGRDGMASWFMAVDDPQPPSGPSAADFEFDVVIQQIRHPLKVIASVAQFILKEGQRAPGFIERNVPETILNPDELKYLDEKEQLILRAARYWYYWNLLTEKKADKIVQLENLHEELPEFCELVGVEFNPDVINQVAPNTNAREFHIRAEPWQIDWQDIERLDPNLYTHLRNLALVYGYEE
jgi:hypothetical protein